ncbi:MAG: polysaccharide biosynthesis C-terminal domain-containing protein [Ignavibacterium sp.]|nr:MAG: polysaccharide biosynthesis C-terminal domain-containing protein [Ignavibacterium sp.]
MSSIVKSSLAVSFFSLLNVAFLFFVEMLLARFFGTSVEMDCYLAAVSIPDLLITVAILGFNYALIPTLVSQLNSNDPQRAYQLINSWLNVVFLFSVTVSIIGALFSNQIIKTFFPGFSEEKIKLAAELLTMYSPVLVLKGSATMISSIFFARQKFLLAPIVPAVGSVFAVVILLAFVHKLGIPAAPIALSVSALIQFLILMGVYTFQGTYRFEIKWRDENFKLIGRLMLPLIIGGIFAHSTFVVDRNIASNLEAGAISTLGYAAKIIRVLLLIGLGGLSVVALPKISELIAKKDFNQIQNLNRKALSGILFVSILFYIVLMNYGEQLISIFFQYGSFSAADSSNVANTIILYGGLLIFGALGTHIAILFYAIPDTKTIALIGIIGFVFAYALKLWFSSFMGYEGIALATTIYYVLSVVLSIYLLQRKELQFISFKELYIDLIKFIVISGIVVVITFIIHSLLPEKNLFQLLIGLPITIVGFIILSFLFNIELSSITMFKRFRESIADEI